MSAPLNAAARRQIAATIGQYHLASRLAPPGRLELGETLERVRLRAFTKNESVDESAPGFLALLKGPRGYIASAVLERDTETTWRRRTLYVSPLAAQYGKALKALARHTIPIGKIQDLVLPFPEWNALVFVWRGQPWVGVVAGPAAATGRILPLYEFSELFLRMELHRFEFMHRDSGERLVAAVRMFRVLPPKQPRPKVRNQWRRFLIPPKPKSAASHSVPKRIALVGS